EEHGGEVVEGRGEVFDALADVRVVFVEGGVAEDVGGDVDPERSELAPGPAEEARDGGETRVLVDGTRILGGAELAVGRESHVVELDLVEPLPGPFAPHCDLVLPYLLPPAV